MTDMTKCISISCELALTCYRKRAQTARDFKSFKDAKTPGKECQFYWPMGTVDNPETSV